MIKNFQDIERTHEFNGDSVDSQSPAYYDDTPGNAETQRLFVKIDGLRKDIERHCLLFTSAMLGEGKSTISSHVAMTCARNWSNKTLLIDFDLRRPRAHKIFNIERENGVAEVLAGHCSFDACIKPSLERQLDVISAGKLETSPLEVFNSGTIRQFIQVARERYKNIIIDSPPVIPVSDPLTLSRFVDHILFVVKAGQTPRKIVKRGLDMFSSANIEISGIVLNNVDNVLPAYFDPKYYGYHYYSYQ